MSTARLEPIDLPLVRRLSARRADSETAVIARRWCDVVRDGSGVRSLQASGLERSGGKESVQLPVRLLTATVPGRARAYLALLLVAGFVDGAHAPCRFPAQQSP